MANKTISDYYENLRYDEFIQDQAEAKLLDLLKNLTFERNDKFSKRLLETATILEKNQSLFQTFSEHVDMVSTVIEYLNYYGTKFEIKNLDKLEERKEIIALINTLSIICGESNMVFLIKNLLQNSDFESSESVISISDQVLRWHNEIIIFEDSDFSMATEILTKFFFNKIWIQEPLVVKISAAVSKSIQDVIHTFRSKQELLNSTVSDTSQTNVLFILSEDIIAVKDLAASLNRDVTFINTYRDMCGGVILPHAKKLNKCFILKDEPTNAKIPNTSELSYNKHNLFYDGMWQKPAKNTYWLNEDHLYANATHDDIKRCINAAEKGAKTWSTRSIDSRAQVLSKLAFVLECNNKHKLADIISKWVKVSYFYNFYIFYKKSVICSQDGRLEITIKHEPRGIVTLKAKSLDTLFSQLTLALLTGNSVIVLCNSVYCSLAPYCDMFSTSGIPPGVINMLSLETVENLYLQDDDSNESELLLEEIKENPFIKFTKPKMIILPVK